MLGAYGHCPIKFSPEACGAPCAGAACGMRKWAIIKAWSLPAARSPQPAKAEAHAPPALH